MYGMEHFSIETGSFQQLQAIYRRFKENGVTVDHTMDHGITNSIYFLDPDGNLIEVYYDVPRAEYPEPVYPFASYGSIDDRLAKTASGRFRSRLPGSPSRRRISTTTALPGPPATAPL